MIISITTELKRKLALIFFIILISLNNVTTNTLSREILIYIRISLIFLIVLLVLSILSRLKNSIITAYIFFFSSVIYGFILCFFSNSITIDLVKSMMIDVMLIALGIYLVTINGMNFWKIKFATIYITYVILAIILTFIIGGLDLSFPPRFIYEYASNLTTQELVYSQGISKFFGFGAIAIFYLIKNLNNIKYKIVLWVIFLSFIILCLMGGSRGDTIFALSVLILYSLYFTDKLKLILVYVLILSIILFNLESFDFLILFDRIYTLTEGNFGYRDILLDQGFNLIGENSRCLILGCGFGFFQSFYGYDYGMYPHNSIIESIITFGIPLTLFILLLTLRGLYLYLHKKNNINIFILFFAYSFLLSLKSGSLFSNWLFIIGIFYFSALAISREKFRYLKMNTQ